MLLGSFAVSGYMIPQPVSSRGKIVKCSQIQGSKYGNSAVSKNCTLKFRILNSKKLWKPVTDVDIWNSHMVFLDVRMWMRPDDGNRWVIV